MASASSFPSSSSSSTAPVAQTRHRTTPYLPAPAELALLAAYPLVLAFGTLFSVISPDVRSAPYDSVKQAHVQTPGLAPSYFARKDNLLNVLFVKRGWAWITLAFFVFVWTHPAVATTRRRTTAALRWAMVTAWWVFVTQWFFGPAIIDRGFRWSGGKCDVVETKVEVLGADGASTGDFVTASACKAVGGRWMGGHDISGHVFMLVLGSAFLLHEVGWVIARWRGYVSEHRTVLMHDGAVKGAGVERERPSREEEAKKPASGGGGRALEALGHGGKLAAVVVGLSGWMLLMTAIYFHTWFEKVSLGATRAVLHVWLLTQAWQFTGLVVAMIGLYLIYIVPRWVPAIRNVVGLPGV